MKFATLLLLVILLVLQYQLWIGNGSMTDVHHLQQVKKDKSEENSELQERNQALAAEVHDLKTGYEAIEERARSEMGMIKKGETFYQLIHNSPASTNDQE
ncbi:MAG TPA: cell division protein FtsB [Gammaproteobacteria bacterium]|nr:cell division protein FtsB [Gammaproteobacteria bacterium]